MPKSLTFEASFVAYMIGIRSILRGLDLLWSQGSLLKGRDGFYGLEIGLELPLLKGSFWVKGLGFSGLGAYLAFFCCSTL